MQESFLQLLLRVGWCPAGSTPPPQAAAATSAQPQQQQAQQAQHEARVTPSVFLRVFCTTFLFEHFLLLVRRTAFDAEKHCEWQAVQGLGLVGPVRLPWIALPFML
jgi:hypothetical protein